MRFANKEFSYYWDVIKIPVGLLVFWGIASVAVAYFSLYWYNSIFTGIPAFIFQIAIFAFIGHVMIAEKKGKLKESTWAGALTGIIAGFAGAILGIIMVNIVPSIIEQAVSQAVNQGAPADTVRQMVKIGIYAGLITGPLFAGLIGALISFISGLITKKVMKK
jgi:hypothetical protein